MWSEAFAQPEVDRLLDGFLETLLNPDATSSDIDAARGSIDAVLRLQSLPALIVASRKNTPPRVQSAQSWRQRLLSIVRTRLRALEEL